RVVLAGSMAGFQRRVRRPGRAAARSGSRRVRVLVREGRVLPAMRNDRLAEPQTGLAELCQLRRAELRVPLFHEAQRLFHPLQLLVTLGTQHAALADRAEQLITRSVEYCRWGGVGTGGGTTLPVITLARQRATSFHAAVTPFYRVRAA